MQADFWHERWAQNRIGFHQDEFHSLLVEYWPKLRISPGANVLVPLAGKTRDITWLIQQGYQVEAIELSDIAVQQYFEEQEIPYQVQETAQGKCFNSDGLRFWAADFFDLQPEQLGQIDAVYDRASLIALPTQMRQHYQQHLQHLAGAVPQLLITLDYEQTEMPGPPFAVSEQEVQNLYAANYPDTAKPVVCVDILSAESHFRERGLTRLSECVYLLQVIKK